MENDIGSLFQVIGDIKGTDACLFIHRHEVPQDSKFTYSRIVCNIIPQYNEKRFGTKDSRRKQQTSSSDHSDTYNPQREKN